MMLGDLTELKTLQAILRLGSLTAAARELGVGTPVVSKRLQTLERRINVRLINRTTRSLSPTEAGSRLLRDIDQVFDTLSSAEDYLADGRGQPNGMLRVSAPFALGRRYIAPALSNLTERYPGLSVSLVLDERIPDLVSEGFDLAIRLGGFSDTTAVMRKLADSRRILVASPAYLSAKGYPRHPADLIKHMLLRNGNGHEPWFLLNENGDQEILTTPERLQANDGDTLMGWASAGLGIAFLSDFDVAPALAAGSLERVLTNWSGPSTPIMALFPTSHHLPPKMRVALDALASQLVAPLANVNEALHGKILAD